VLGQVHLFDIDVPGRITFKESEMMSAGNQLTLFDTGQCSRLVGDIYLLIYLFKIVIIHKSKHNSRLTTTKIQTLKFSCPSPNTIRIQLVPWQGESETIRELQTENNIANVNNFR